MIDEIQDVIASALRMDAATPDSVGVELRFVGLDVETFARFREDFDVEDDDLVFAKLRLRRLRQPRRRVPGDDV